MTRLFECALVLVSPHRFSTSRGMETGRKTTPFAALRAASGSEQGQGCMLRQVGPPR